MADSKNNVEPTMNFHEGYNLHNNKYCFHRSKLSCWLSVDNGHTSALSNTWELRN